MNFILINILLSLSQHILVLQVDFTNQTVECKTWIKNHVFIYTELHSNIVNTDVIFIQFDNFTQLERNQL